MLTLARGVNAFDHAFGRKDAVDPIKHLLGTASGWGGLPEQEAFYINVDPGFPTGEYKVTVGDVPVDGFWSISVYNADGYFEANDRNAYSVNNITATPERRRLDHRALRWLRRRPTELPADHGRLELRRAPVPTTTRDPRRHLDLPAAEPA